ncbi:hypothetical protein ACFOWE_24980, partial [Planomonospora corallina]
MPEPVVPEATAAPEAAPGTLRGLGVGPGLAAGRAFRMAGPPPLPAPAGRTDPGRERGEALRA